MLVARVSTSFSGQSQWLQGPGGLLSCRNLPFHSKEHTGGDVEAVERDRRIIDYKGTFAQCCKQEQHTTGVWPAVMHASRGSLRPVWP
jgi:hypothetical protein